MSIKRRRGTADLFVRASAAVGLFCAKQPVARIAQSGNDVAVVVEVAVDACDVDVDVGVFLVEFGDAFRRRYQGDQRNALSALFFYVAHGGCRRAASCEHRVDYEDVAL